jgi:STE24 endopeptidase
VTLRRLLPLAIVIGIVIVWWASGLGRAAADPRDFFSEAEIARAERYRSVKEWATVAAIAVNLGVLGFLAFTRMGERLLGWARAWPWAVGAAAAVLVVLVVRALLRLPIAFYSGHVHERAWGFSTQGPAGWFADWAKGLGISIALTAIVFVDFVALVRWLPRGWPLAAAAGAALFTVLASFLWPVVIEPAFNRFEPLRDEAFAAELRELADRAGVPVREVLVSDASRRTTKENAYVSGFGATKRLVLYDTLLENASRDEVALVVAHELGHRRARHVEWWTAIGALGAAALALLVAAVLRSQALLARVGADGPGDPRVVPLFLLVMAVATLVTLPPSNWLSRRFEESADRFALQLTGDRAVYVETERGLALRNLSDLDPGPVAYRFLFTHPAPAERISYAYDEG